MQLRSLIAQTPVKLVHGNGLLPVLDMTDDSRRVEPGMLFVARRGCCGDGHAYIDQALASGAVAVLAERPVPVPASVPLCVCDVLDSGLLMVLAGRLFGSDRFSGRLIGVTGTNGKTTTAYMIRHLMESSGERWGLIGTVSIHDGLAGRPASLTTPGVIDLCRWLGRMQVNGCQGCVMEVSSHALDQGRVSGLDFAGAVFTNLSGDHLDYHLTMDRYADAKSRLFEGLSAESVAVVNAADPASDRMVRDTRARVIRFGLTDRPAEASGLDYAGRVLAADASGSRFELLTSGGVCHELFLPLPGRYNIANCLGALSVCAGCGLALDRMIQAVATCPPVPGRVEPVSAAHGSAGFTALVDYAHTDDALDNVLSALRSLTSGRLIVVFGCGGDRDARKRPRMAAVACRWSDRVIVTNDNPRSESPDQIIADISSGLDASMMDAVSIIADRRSAIRQAVFEAVAGDVILVAGKGHEDYQIIGSERLHFDDRDQLRSALAARLADRREVV